jgi:uncharacterized protein (PEP-CTERM system associated)
LLRAGVAMLALAANMAWAQEKQPQQTRIVPALNTSLGWTDNVGATHNGKADWLLEISPGLRIEREGSRLRGLVNTQLRSIAYARDSGRNTTFVALQGTGSFEVIDNRLFIDLDSSIDRTNRSAFSGRASGDSLSVDKDDETRSWRLGPRLNFRLGNAAQGMLRYHSSWLDSGQKGFGEQRQNQWMGQLGNPQASRLIGWDASYQDTDTHYGSTGQDVNQKLGRATMYVNLNPQFRLRFTGGYESADYGYGNKDRGAIYGGGFDWNPTPRTVISVLSEERPRGNSYTVSLRHRGARTVWNAAAARDITSSLDSLGGGIYQDPQFQAYYNDPALVAQLPDPTLREAFVRQILGYPPAGGTGEFVSNVHFLAESWRAGVTLNGARNALTLSVQRSNRKRLSSGTGLAVAGDFALTDRIDTHAATVDFTHRLTPLSLLNASLSRSRSEGSRVSKLDTWRTTGSLGLSARLGPKTRAGVTYRYLRSDGIAVESDYSENSVTANFGLTF